MFHLIRFAHIADSCVNCGQCEETLCDGYPERPLHACAAGQELEKMFGYVPGVDMNLPVLALVDEQSERDRLSATGSDQIFDIFK